MKRFGALFFVAAVFALLIGGVFLGEAIHKGSGKWLGVTLVAIVFAAIRWHDYEFRKLPVAIHIAGALVLLALIGRTTYLLLS